MRYVISDIHGNFKLLINLLNKIKFSQKDTLFILGDLIDKGTEVDKVLKLIFRDIRKNVFVIAGNHEHEFIKYVKFLINENESDDVILKKSNEFLKLKNPITFEIIDEILNLPYYYEEKDFLLVHAGIPCDENGFPLSIKNVSKEELVYDRRFKNENFIPQNFKCVIFGHTPTIKDGKMGNIIKYQRPNTRGNKVTDYYKIHIDTGNYLSKTLGCLCLDTMQEFYVTEN